MSAAAPSYLALHESGELSRRADRALQELGSCRVCPRNCDNDRLADEIAVCRTGRHAIVSSAFPHFGEEDCLRGWNGSGTIFFSYCNLKCVFCQNWDISQEGQGSRVNATELAELMFGLQRRGCHNLNLVTPEHVVPQILEALPRAVEMGLRLPIVYNTSAYDSLTSLGLLDGIVDVYMPDFKFWDRTKAKRLLLAEDYPDNARRSIREMHRQVGALRFDQDGLARRGVLLRHLIMPGGLAGTREIMRFLATEISSDTYVNIMAQYSPGGRVGRFEKFREIGRSTRPAEVEEAYRIARAAGLHRFDGE
ncbi:MAG: radical SAM protein [Planctomycetota bacterium]